MVFSRVSSKACFRLIIPPPWLKRWEAETGVPYLADSSAFQSALASAGGKLVAVDFTATWCGPCHEMIGPQFEAIRSRSSLSFVDFRCELGGRT